MESEDKSLDDFFAKKDKGKKGKSKGKGKAFNTSSAINTKSKQVESSQKAVTDQFKEQKPSSGQTAHSQKEDEWVDFNEPKEKDYSGLKVQSFQTREKVVDEPDEGTGSDDEFDGDDSEKKDKASGVWQASTVQPIAPVIEPPKEEIKTDAVVKGGVYVPPSMRGNMSRGGGSDLKDQSWKYGSGGARRDPRRPPEIASEIAFPSLQTSADVSSKSEAMSAMKFETVKQGHGARATTEQYINRRTNIDIGNKYDALSK